MRISILVDKSQYDEIHKALRTFEVPYTGFEKLRDGKLAMMFEVPRYVINQIRSAIDGIGVLEDGFWFESPAMMEPCTSSS